MLQREITVGLGSFAVGAATGAAVGYLILRNRVETKYRELAEAEIAEIREFYRAERARMKVVRDPKPPLDEELMTDLGYLGDGEHEGYNEVELAAIAEVNAEVAAEEDEVLVEEDIPEWDYAVEIKSRVEGEPHIIHYDEFEEGPEGYCERHFFTYFEGDDTMVDSNELVLDDFVSLIGTRENLRWGHGSVDDDTVLIRNEKRGMDMEITRDEGKYGHQDHGFVQHNHQQRFRRRVRFDDE